jgi:hypothetical protein
MFFEKLKICMLHIIYNGCWLLSIIISDFVSKILLFITVVTLNTYIAGYNDIK